MPAHPLAVALADLLVDGAHVLDFGTGSGRNASFLASRGFDVFTIDDAHAAGTQSLPSHGGRFDAVIATHALLHGTPASVGARVTALAAALREGGLFFAVFASKRDARYGSGDSVDDDTWALREGDEAGVPHVFYDETGLRTLLRPHFVVDVLDECGADEIAGTWAHPTTPLSGAVHWLVQAIRQSQ